MFREAIYHKIDSDYAYSLNEKEVLIKLRSKKGDLDRVILEYTDKYQYIYKNKKMKKQEMVKVATDNLFDYYEGIIEDNFISLAYDFNIYSGEESVFLGSKGFSNKKITHDSRLFIYPSLEKYDVFEIPDWSKESIVYQIFPERFYRGDNYTDVKENDGWYENVHYKSKLGGTLKGIMDKLDYLIDLGINTIYLCPIFKAKSNHKYDTEDYYEIDEEFGDKEIFGEFMKECHNRGIRVILDAVLNHSSREFFAFTDILEKGEESKYLDWYSIEKFPMVSGKEPNYKTFAGYYGMPKLNYNNIQVRNYFKDVILYWIREFDIDGWRFDVADEVPHKFWKELRLEVKKVKKDVLLIGEVWYDSSSWLGGDEFDSVMNYEFFNAVLDFVASGTISKKEFIERLDGVRGNYKKQSNEILWNLIGSHDTPRFLHNAKESISKLRLALFIQMTMPGTPFIYYGDEVGMTGGKDPMCRMGMLWDDARQNVEMLNYSKKLIKIRKENKELLCGEREALEQDENSDILSYRMRYGEKYLDIYLNSSRKKSVVELSGEYIDLVEDKRVGSTFEIKGRSGVILRKI